MTSRTLAKHQCYSTNAAERITTIQSDTNAERSHRFCHGGVAFNVGVGTIMILDRMR